ncbi:diguanylate cyclase domain-containing protein [Geodermatophilus sp. SYSU D00758]
MSDPRPAEPRETSGATTGLVLGYVRQQAGDAAVAEVLRRAGTPYTAEELSHPSSWTSYDTRIRLFAAATEVLGDPDTMFRVGREALSFGMNPALVLVVRAMGSPRQVFRRLPPAVAKFSTTSTMEILDAGATSATVRFTLHPGYAHSRLDCLYVQGLIGMVPSIFGLPPAEVVHEECESDGHPACLYHLTWERRLRLGTRRRDRRAAEPELLALREQLRTLQTAATELVASDDLGTVLQRIVVRAAEAVLAPAHLLAVADPAGGRPLVHSAGLPEDAVPALAAQLLAGEDLGPDVVAVDVASTRRRHGRLAALYAPGVGLLGDEAAMLAAYAGHAAAALDLLMARDSARLEADRAGRLLALAHELAGATDAAAVCRVVADALPRVVGCDSASMMLWDPATAALHTAATAGLSPRAREHLLATSLHAEDVPELVGMITDREPRFLGAASSPVVRELLDVLGLSDGVAVPIAAGRTFLGVATASWPAGRAPASLAGDILARLRGVGDQAATALQRARLLETVRHQATHDVLTGLPNRGLFLDLLGGALAATGPGGHVGVLFCDLDRFKAVNDTHGHAAGDELLRQVAARLRAAVRPGDSVGRLSGDEFAVLLPELSRPEDADRVVARVLGCFEDTFRLDGVEVAVGTSVGVAVHSGEWGSADALLRRADEAMYRHKHVGRQGPEAFDG